MSFGLSGSIGSSMPSPAVPVPASDRMDRAKRRVWRDEKNMTVFCFHHPDHPMRRVDVFIDEPYAFGIWPGTWSSFRLAAFAFRLYPGNT